MTTKGCWRVGLAKRREGILTSLASLTLSSILYEMLKKHYKVPRVTTLLSFLQPNYPPHGDNSLFTTPHLSRDSSSSICALNFEWTLSLLPPFHSPFCSNNIATGQSLSALSLSLHPFGEYKITLLTVAERWERSRCPASLEIPWKHIRFWDDLKLDTTNVSGQITHSAMQYQEQ